MAIIPRQKYRNHAQLVQGDVSGGGANANSTKRRIRKLLSRVLHPSEVDFLVTVWKAGNIRAADCPKVAVSLLQRDWIECDGRYVRLSEQTQLLLAENVE